MGGDVPRRRCGPVRTGSKGEGIERNSFAVVRSSDAATNLLTVELPDGSSVEYDLKRIYGVNVYRETSREFAPGDKLQFSALNRELGLSNRDMGTITKMDPDRLWVLMDGKERRSVSFNPSEFRQFGPGSAVTSHRSQGLTADRVIANIDTESSRSLINNRLAYVAFSRASEDARICTNNAEILGQRLATDVTKTVALDLAAKIQQQQEFTQIPKNAKSPHRSRVQQPGLTTCRRSQRLCQPPRAQRDRRTQLRRA